LILPLLGSALQAQEVEPGFKSLFNGKDLSGWSGRTNFWSVEQGFIIDTPTKEDPTQGNTFLTSKVGDQDFMVDDFELRCSYRFQSPAGNSGIQ